MNDYEEKERAWERMAEATKRRKRELHSDEALAKSNRKGGLKWLNGRDLQEAGMF